MYDKYFTLIANAVYRGARYDERPREVSVQIISFQQSCAFTQNEILPILNKCKNIYLRFAQCQENRYSRPAARQALIDGPMQTRSLFPCYEMVSTRYEASAVDHERHHRSHFASILDITIHNHHFGGIFALLNIKILGWKCLCVFGRRWLPYQKWLDRYRATRWLIILFLSRNLAKLSPCLLCIIIFCAATSARKSAKCRGRQYRNRPHARALSILTRARSA